MFNKTDHVRMT